MSEGLGSNGKFELILVNALKVPGVKVNRKEFLAQALVEYIDPHQLPNILEKGPIDAGVSIQVINKVAKSLIDKRTVMSTLASTAAGIPGGLAMAATIPADTLQFFGVALRMSQELAYLFGHKDFWDNETLDIEKVRGEFTLFLGVMFGVGGSTAALKVLSIKVSQQMLKKLPQQALTKTIYYPIIKKIAAAIGVKMTKDTFAKGLSKMIPVLGGLLSGGLTYLTMKPMGNRLREALLDTAKGYSEEEFEKDLEEVKKEIDIDFESEIIDVEMEIMDVESEQTNRSKGSEENKAFSVADELLKFKQLLDMGVLTQEEFDLKKSELLSLKY